MNESSQLVGPDRGCSTRETGVPPEGGTPVAAAPIGHERAADEQPTRTLHTGARYRRPRPRVTEFVPIRAAVGDVLARLGDNTERVYLVGPRPVAVTAWATEQLPQGWTHDDHYLHPNTPVLRFRGPAGRRVEVHRVEAWTGEAEQAPTVGDLGAAWALVSRLVKGRFGEAAELLGTPSTTGRDLFLRTIPDGRRWTVLPDYLQALIRSTSGQGRIEGCWDWPTWPGRPGPLPRLVELDGRLMYGALCRELGAVVESEQVPELETGGGTLEFDPYARGRFLVDYRVPRDWDHVGMLPAPADGGGWRYPNRAGERAEAWVDGAELLQASRAGWSFRIRGRVVFPPYRGEGPLDGWARRLLGIVDKLERREGISPEVRGLALAVVRSIILHGLGAFQGRGSRITRVRAWPAPKGTIPKGAEGLKVDGGLVSWTETTGAAWPELSHPEWSAAVWARARARLAAQALRVPFGEVVALSTDALYVSTDPAGQGWPAKAKPGHFRVKGGRRGPLPVPSSRLELLGMRADA